MIVDRNSWHMRVARFSSDGSYEPRDLCSHFWKVVLGLGVGLSLSLAVVTASPVWLPILGVWYVCHQWGERHPKIETSRVHGPSLIGAWLHAKAGRYCPTIEVRKDTEKE